MTDAELDVIAADDQDPDIFIQVGVFGKSLSDYLMSKAIQAGVRFTSQFAEDYAHVLEIKHSEKTRVWIECSADIRKPEEHDVTLRVLQPLIAGLFSSEKAEVVAQAYLSVLDGILANSDQIEVLQVY